MHAIHPRTEHHVAERASRDGRFPWEEAHAAFEDQAVGLELELIELVHRREILEPGNDRQADLLDREIDQTLARLGALTPALPA